MIPLRDGSFFRLQMLTRCTARRDFPIQPILCPSQPRSIGSKSRSTSTGPRRSYMAPRQPLQGLRVCCGFLCLIPSAVGMAHERHVARVNASCRGCPQTPNAPPNSPGVALLTRAKSQRRNPQPAIAKSVTLCSQVCKSYSNWL